MKLIRPCLNWGLVISILFFCACNGDDDSTTNPEPAISPVTKRIISFTTEDGVRIAGQTARATAMNIPSPTVILIHANDSDRSEWEDHPFYDRLIEENYFVLTYDIRNYGESENDGETNAGLLTDPDRAPLDLEAALDFLEDEPLVNQDKIAAIGTQLGAELACIAASTDELAIKTAVALTPVRTAVIELSANYADFELQSSYFIASELDLNGVKAQDAEDLFNESLEPKKLEIILDSDLTGTEMILNDPTLGDRIFDWLRDNL